MRSRTRRGGGGRRIAARRWAGDDGSVLPIVVLVVVAAAGLAVAVGRVGVDAVASARAQAAADAAALAGAAEGEVAARRLAEGNGGRLVTYVAEGDEVEVAVEVGGARARARAERTVGAGSATGVRGPGSASLTPEMRAAIARAEVALGRSIPISSGWRSPAAQQRLWDRRAANPYPVARPGTSSHERGTAIDVPLAIAPALARIGPAAGVCRPLPASDPVHFELCGPRGRAGRARPRRRPASGPWRHTRPRPPRARRSSGVPRRSRRGPRPSRPHVARSRPR